MPMSATVGANDGDRDGDRGGAVVGRHEEAREDRNRGEADALDATWPRSFHAAPRPTWRSKWREGPSGLGATTVAASAVALTVN